eukprot:gene3995-14482_t
MLWEASIPVKHRSPSLWIDIHTTFTGTDVNTARSICPGSHRRYDDQM